MLMIEGIDTIHSLRFFLTVRCIRAAIVTTVTNQHHSPLYLLDEELSRKVDRTSLGHPVLNVRRISTILRSWYKNQEILASRCASSLLRLLLPQFHVVTSGVDNIFFLFAIFFFFIILLVILYGWWGFVIFIAEGLFHLCWLEWCIYAESSR